MRLSSFLILICSMSLALLPAHADGPAPGGERLFVGATGIYCVQAPCPWRGIARDMQAAPADLLWSRDDLPKLDAGIEDRDRLNDAWADGACLEIHGLLLGKVLRVDRVIGPCP